MMNGALLSLGRSDVQHINTEGPRGNRWMNWSEGAETETAHSFHYLFHLCSSCFALKYLVQLVCWMFLWMVFFNFQLSTQPLRVDAVVFCGQWSGAWLDHNLLLPLDVGCLMFWSMDRFLTLRPCLYVKRCEKYICEVKHFASVNTEALALYWTGSSVASVEFLRKDVPALEVQLDRRGECQGPKSGVMGWRRLVTIEIWPNPSTKMIEFMIHDGYVSIP